MPSAAHATTTEPGVTIQRPDLALTTGEIARMGSDPAGASTPIRVLVVSAPRGDISWEEFSRLANGQPVPGVTVVRSADNVAPSTTVGSLTNGQPPSVAKK